MRGKIELGEVQQMTMLIIYRIGSLVKELDRTTRKDVL